MSRHLLTVPVVAFLLVGLFVFCCLLLGVFLLLLFFCWFFFFWGVKVGWGWGVFWGERRRVGANLFDCWLALLLGSEM